MNYNHSHHAGSFADVTKHVILTMLILSLSDKNTPFCYIDTHAGSGYYDLFSKFAAKRKEYMGGIEKIIQQDNPPGIINRYLDCVHRINNQLTASQFAALRYYPGSPLIARYLMRPHDRIIACELQPQEYQALKNTFMGDKQAAIHHMDGFLGLKAFLPPHERRGLVLIDPPYEDPDEFTRIAHSLPVTLKKWETGTYVIWYPIKEKNHVDRFYYALKETINKPMLAVELTIYPDLPQHFNGCGMVILNPPWQLDTSLQTVLPWLWKTLTINHQGHFSSKKLNYC